MYRSTTPALPCEQEPSEAVREFARVLHLQADIIDDAGQRLRAVEQVDWESPAGRNFRSYLAYRTAGLMTAAALVREAAASMASYAAALQADEVTRGFHP